MKPTNLPRDRVLLLKIVEYCDYLLREVASCQGIEAFLADVRLQQSCAFAFIQIGESYSKLSDTVRGSHLNAPLKVIRDLRNTFVHRYSSSSPAAVWDAMEARIKPLKVNCLSAVREIQKAQQGGGQK